MIACSSKATLPEEAWDMVSTGGVLDGYSKHGLNMADEPYAALIRAGF